MPHVSSIIIYPVKSAQGLPVTKANITDFGFEHDRRWAIVSRMKMKSDADHENMNNDWRVENQWASHRRLASIVTNIEEGESGSLTLVLSAPGVKQHLRVPIRSVADPKRRITVRDVQRTTLPFAEDEGNEAAAWLTSYLALDRHLDTKFRLAWCPPDAKRWLSKDPRYGSLMAAEDCTAFADTAQFHLTSVSSLAALTRDMRRVTSNYEGTIAMDCFRPNIVVDGFPEYAEDHWHMIEFERGVVLRVCMPDLRCSVIDNEQSGARAGSRGTAFQMLREIKNLRPAVLRGGAVFGVKLNLLRKVVSSSTTTTLSSVSVGDACVIKKCTKSSLLELDLAGLRAELLPELSSKENLYALIKPVHVVVSFALALAVAAGVSKINL